MKKFLLLIISIVLFLTISKSIIFVHKVWKVFSNPEQHQPQNKYADYKYRAEMFFDNPKVIEFCKSLESGDFKRADELLKEGVDINTEGKRGMTPFLWSIFYSLPKTQELEKQAFQYFLQKKANPLKIAEIEGKIKGGYYPQTVLHYVAELKDPWYLKELLESGIIEKKNIDFEKEKIGIKRTATLAALLPDRLINFKMLLDYGADINWKSEGGVSLLENTLRQIDWQFTYELLKRGAEFKDLKAPNGDQLIDSYLKDEYSPSTIINYKGTDYRQKVVYFLEKHGIEVHSWMPKDEKYVKENGKYQLYINEKYKPNLETNKVEIENKEDHWVKFEDSYRYDPDDRKENANNPYQTTYQETQQQPIDYSFKKDFPDED